VSRQTLFAAALWAIATVAWAQNWPTGKPVRLVVAYPPGGVSDSVGRALAERLAVQLATPVLVENKAGASGSIGIEAVAKAPPDGYTLAFASTSPLTLNPHLATSTLSPTFDPLKDIAPVARVMLSPVLLVATPATRANTLPELLALARARPGGVRWATSGMASLGHIMQAQLAAAANVTFTHVPYKGGGQQITDGLGGQYEVLSVNADAAVLQHIKAGRLRALAVGAPARLDALPLVPTLKELGFESANLMSIFGIYAPAGVPAATLDRLHAEVNQALATPALRERLAASDNVPAPASRAEFIQQIAADFHNNGRMIKAASIKAD
jgi:tripartite-type tricarboxylate transporter receptor subunit TctC